MLNARTAAARTEHDSSHFERTRSSEMNVKSITGQLGERRARFELSSDSAHPLADHWSVSDFVALNMWYDADIDAVMTRTAMRPIPRGKISRFEALVFGLVLGGFAVVVLGLATNLTAAALLACTILFYIVVYTAWLKRATRQNIVIGGAAGALPPVIGWVAATGEVGLEPLTLFLIIFLWTPPHFWALALNRTDDYARAG